MNSRFPKSHGDRVVTRRRRSTAMYERVTDSPEGEGARKSRTSYTATMQAELSPLVVQIVIGVNHDTTEK